jgi:hypothetical protein
MSTKKPEGFNPSGFFIAEEISAVFVEFILRSRYTSYIPSTPYKTNSTPFSHPT